MKTLPLVATLLVATAAAAGTAAAKANNDAAAAFANLKTLAGEWEGTTSMGKVHLSYQIISGGNALVEREISEKMPEMLTVYYLDGNRLLLTHYCAAGNQPRMEAKAFDAEGSELRFQFLDATNLTDPNAGHMHNVTLHFVDKNHVSSQWQFFENGLPKLTETAQYARVR